MAAEKNPEDSHTSVSCDIIAKPSKGIGVHETTLSLENVPVGLTLVTMKRSLLLVIHDTDSNSAFRFLDIDATGMNEHMAREMMIQGFTNSNRALKGLALSIGDHSTCIISSENSLNSATLASRISKKLNYNRPVYVASNLEQPQHVLDSGMVMAKFYMRVFEFVKSNYRSTDQEPQQDKTTDDQQEVRVTS